MGGLGCGEMTGIEGGHGTLSRPLLGFGQLLRTAVSSGGLVGLWGWVPVLSLDGNLKSQTVAHPRGCIPLGLPCRTHVNSVAQPAPGRFEFELDPGMRA